jgi:site-specific DNA-methyltransferase (adenine-specific)
MVDRVLFTSDKEDWATPQDFYDAADKIFDFDLDPCATNENAKCPFYYTKEIDGLKEPWFGNVWVNPPYGRNVKEWVKKGYDEVQKENAKTVVILLPARTETRYWNEYCVKADEIWFIKGRLRFEGANNSAPFPSVLVVFNKNKGLRVVRWCNQELTEFY